MNRFAPDFAEVKAGLKIYDRGEYEVKVTGVDGFAYVRDKDKVTVVGVKYKLEMVGKLGNDGTIFDDTDAGESVVPMKLYIHSKKGWGFTKQTLMALFGYTDEQEDDFNEAIEGYDFGVEPTDDEPDEEGAFEVEIGGSWKEPVGGRIHVTLKKGIWEERPTQEFVAIRPAS